MADLPAGVTRYPLRQGLNWKVWTPQFAMPTGVAFVAAMIAVLVFGGEVPTIVALVALGVAVPPLTIVVRPWVRVFVVLALVVGLLFRSEWETDLGFGYVACFATSLGLGMVWLGWLVGGRRWRARMAAGEGAPASGLDPAGGTDVKAVLATWRDDEHDYEAVDPSPEVVLAAVRSLGAPGHSVVSIYRGRARLDVGGDPAGVMVVQQADDRRRWRYGFSVADPAYGAEAAPSASGSGPREVVWFGGGNLSVPTGLLTSLGAAETAVRSWLATGTRAESLTWWTPAGRRPRLPRPERLREQDRPGSTATGNDLGASSTY